MHTVLKKVSLLTVSLMLIAAVPSVADSRLGANLAAPKVFAFLDTIPLVPNGTYTLSDAEMDKFLGLASDIHINVFEMIDCAFRYLTPRSERIVIEGSSLRKLQGKYDLGGERVLAILSIEKVRYLETGARLKAGQEDLDIYLQSPVETFIEIGTASYETRYGFRTLKPLLFDGAYGIMVKKMILSTPLEKLELFAPGKGAIYVKGLSRPKKWNLDVITYLH